jgi:hypothetical protein
MAKVSTLLRRYIDLRKAITDDVSAAMTWVATAACVVT